MSMYDDGPTPYDTGYEYFGEASAFDQEVDGFKEALRKSVKKEIAEELEKLRATVKEQCEKLKNLDTLEAEARAEKNAYERKLQSAEFDAHTKVQKEGIRKLLDVLAEPRYRVEYIWRQGPKCNKCNEKRALEYTTPRGKPATEQCECAISTPFPEVNEQLVHEISKRNGRLMVWYDSTARHYNRDNPDSISSPAVLKSPVGVSDEDLMKNPSDYGFTSKEDAQCVADALIKEGEGKWV